MRPATPGFDELFRAEYASTLRVSIQICADAEVGRFGRAPIAGGGQLDPEPPGGVEPFELPAVTGDPQGTVVGGGAVGTDPWRLTATEANPAIGSTDRRVCTIFRSTHRGHQTCFPVTGDHALQWAYDEIHLGHRWLVIASRPGTTVGDEVHRLTAADPASTGLPVQLHVFEVAGTMSIRVGDGVLEVDVPGDRAEGSRSVLAGDPSPPLPA